MNWRTLLLCAAVALSLVIAGCGRRVQRPKKKEAAKPSEPTTEETAHTEEPKDEPKPKPEPPPVVAAASKPVPKKDLPTAPRETAANIVLELEDAKQAHRKTQEDLLVLAKKYAEAERNIARLKAAPPPSQPTTAAPSKAGDAAEQRLLALARGFYDDGKYDAAKKVLETLINVGHRGGYAYFMLARCHAELGLPDKAINYYKMTCDFYEPVNPKPKYYLYALNNLGALLRSQKRYREAKIVYERAQFVNPDYANAYYNLGVLHADYLNDKRTAVEHFQKYVELKGERSADVQRRIRKLLGEIKAEEKK